MPHAFGLYDWFEARFGDLCNDHDAAYSLGIPRKTADLTLATGIMLRGYFILGLLTYIFVHIFGYFHYKH